MKKILIILSILLVSLNNVHLVFADDQIFTEGNYQYTIDDAGSATIVYYYGHDKQIKIPKYIGMNVVVAIDRNAFTSSNADLIYLPNSVIYIEENAFLSSTTIKYYDDDGNTVNDVDTKAYEDDLTLKEETKDLGDGFEETVIDIEEDINKQIEEEKIEETSVTEKENDDYQNKKRNRKFQLFDASKFVSNFNANPVGYVLISILIIAFICIVIKLIIKK